MMDRRKFLKALGLTLIAPEIVFSKDPNASHWSEWSTRLPLDPDYANVDIRSLAVFNDKIYVGTAPHDCLLEWNGVDEWIKRSPDDIE